MKDSSTGKNKDFYDLGKRMFDRIQVLPEHQAMASTPHTELLAELMNPNIPKNDREHAAVREIERLQKALAQPAQHDAPYWIKHYGNNRVPSIAQPVQPNTDMAYTIALQRAIEWHCEGKAVPPDVAALCPYHAERLNKTLTQPEQCLDCGSHNLGVPANYDSVINSVKLDHIANAGNMVEQEPWKCVCGANLYIDENGKPRSKASQQETDWEAVAADQAMTIAMMKIEQEPVAWGFQNSAITGRNRWMMLREDIPTDDQYGGALWTPLYTSPPQRQPLTHEQRLDLLTAFKAHKHEWHAESILIDMVEAAHGIGDKT